MGTEFIRALEEHRVDTLGRRVPEAAPLSHQIMLSWIHHDNLVEGQLYRPDEIRQALRSQDHEIERYLHPLMRNIRAYRDAICYVWSQAHKGPQVLGLDSLKKIHRIITSDRAEPGGKYRHNSPVHRAYSQRICAAERVPYNLRKLFDQVRSECDEACDAIDFAAAMHLRLMAVYPFRHNPGTTCRLITNLLLLSRGYPPLIIPASARPEYYVALCAKDSDALASLFRDCIRPFLGVTVTEGLHATH